MFDADTIEKAQARMESRRAMIDSECAEAAAMLLPEGGDYNVRYRQEGVATSHLVYDDYCGEAFQDGVSVFEGFTMRRGQKWQKTRLDDEALMADVENLRWLERVDDRVFALRQDPKSGFVANVHASAESLMAGWGQSMWIDKRFDHQGRFEGLSYQSEDVAGVWIERDAAGNVIRIHRMILLTAEQVVRKWPDKAPKAARDAMGGSQPRPETELEIIHVIERNPRVLPGRIDAAGMPWGGAYYCRQGKEVFEVGGYRTLRRIVSSFQRKAGRDYGRGPGLRLLRALRACQVMMQDRIIATERAVFRPMLAVDDDLDEAIIDLSRDGVTYGAIDEMGRRRIEALYDAPNLSDAAALHAELRQVIDKGFFRDLLQLHREMKTHVSATRIMEEIAEKGVLLAPLASQEQEWFSPMLDVELDLMWEEGMLDDMPDGLRQYFAEGGTKRIVYDNPLRQMMLAQEAAGYLRTAEQVATLAAFDPDAVAEFKREYPSAKVIPGLGEANGIPSRWRATEDEKAAMDEAAAQDKLLAQMTQAAPALAGAAKDMAQAGAIGGAGGGGMGFGA